MNPPTAVQPERTDRGRHPAKLAVAALAAAVAGAVALTLLIGGAAGPTMVPRLTFENPTDYALDIEVSSGDGAGWTSAGSVRQRSTAVVREVPDQGEAWVFRFDSQGETGGELRLSRSELEALDWRVAIPAEVGRRLADAGAPPTP